MEQKFQELIRKSIAVMRGKLQQAILFHSSEIPQFVIRNLPLPSVSFDLDLV